MDPYEARLIRWCAWSAILFMVLFGIGWGVLGRNIPPYPASYSADHIARIYREHKDTLRIGFAVGAFSTTFMVPWVLGLFRIMSRMERRGQIMSYLQLAGGLLTVPVPFVANVVWLTAAFRPETDPAITRMLFDLGWLVMDVGFGVTILQYVAIGVVALQDQRPVPLFPKWMAWLGIWLGLEFVVELIMPYFRSGPFAWNGLFAYWLPFFGPFLWMVATVVYMIKATRRLELEGTDGAAAPSLVGLPQPVPS